MCHGCTRFVVQSFWNVVECFILCLCITAIVMFFYRLFIGQRMEDDIHDDPYVYHNFQYLIIWDEVGRDGRDVIISECFIVF